MINIKEKNIILIISLGVFVVSMALSFYLNVPPLVDAKAYDNIAVNLIEGRGYVENVSIPFEKDLSIIRVGPGYEIFLAFVYKVFGHHYVIVKILQSLFHALSVILIFLISKQIFGSDWKPIIGFASAFLVGLSPDLLIASSMLLTENVAIFLMLCSVYFFFRYYNSESWFDMLLLSFFFAISVTTRSQFIVLAVVFSVLFVLRKKWVNLLIFLLIITAVFSPWVIRNYKTYDEFIPFNAALGFNLWSGNRMDANGEMDMQFKEMVDYMQDHTPIEVHKKGINEFGKFILQHPVKFAELTLRRASIFFSFSRPTGFWLSFTPTQQGVSAFFSLIYSVFIFTLGFMGIIISFKKFNLSKEKILYFLGMAFFVPLSILVILVETRYRYPIYPFLAVFGGFAISETIDNKDVIRSNIKILFWVFVVLLANSVFDFAINFERFWDKIKGLF